LGVSQAGFKKKNTTGFPASEQGQEMSRARPRVFYTRAVNRGKFTKGRARHSGGLGGTWGLSGGGDRGGGGSRHRREKPRRGRFCAGPLFLQTGLSRHTRPPGVREKGSSVSFPRGRTGPPQKPPETPTMMGITGAGTGELGVWGRGGQGEPGMEGAVSFSSPADGGKGGLKISPDLTQRPHEWF